MGKIIAAFLSVFAVIAGILTGLSLFAYSIYTIVLMVKGTVAVSFFGILKVVALWVCAGLGGWAVALIILALAALIATNSK